MTRFTEEYSDAHDLLKIIIYDALLSLIKEKEEVNE